MEENKEKWKDFKFEIFGSTWNVKFVDSIDGTDPSQHCTGMCYGERQLIEVAIINSKGERNSDEVISIILTHEIVHAILSTGNYEDYNNDEPLVEFMARSIIQLTKQKVFQYVKE